MPISTNLLTMIFTILFYYGSFSLLYAQKDATPPDVKKPEQYQKRILGSDKTFTTKYTVPRKIIQNLSTHYNFHFNANIKLDEVVLAAKQSFRDDYTKLLPVYNYTLEATASQKIELDSVLHKCNAAIMLHDLRNEWIDDMYFLMGKAYLFKKQFDSAHIAFQYVNFHFLPKTEQELGVKKFVGSNRNDEGNVYTVSTKEKRNIYTRLINEPPARNDALIWTIRNKIEDSSYDAASALIQTLKRDSIMPERLQPYFNELQAYYHYQHKTWDSAAYYLIQSMKMVSGSHEKARREFLIAQLLALANDYTEAAIYYDLAIKHAIDPVMEIYARLHKLQLAEGDDALLEANIKQLLKMARRDRFYNYRNIIYYMAAQLEMKRDNYDNAITHLFKSVRYNNQDLAQRNRTFLYLGDIAFKHKDYELAATAYDSLDINSPVIEHKNEVATRKEGLLEVIRRLKIIHVEDSLQHVAAMPEQERERYLLAAIKRMRKEQGLKEDEESGGRNNPFANNAASDLFATSNNKGEWYFYNNSLKGAGFNEFQAAWGNRPNVDNWRRKAGMGPQIASKLPDRAGEGDVESIRELTLEALAESLPLTPGGLKASHDTIQSAMFVLGTTFKDKFEDYREAIAYYQDLLSDYPETFKKEEVLMGLYFCYFKLGDMDRAGFYKELLSKHAPKSKFLALLNDPQSLEDKTKKVENDATANYEEIYNIFLSGQFEEALERKRVADSIYGNVYWTQQLLYIEAVYHVSQREDSLAISALQHLIHKDRNAGMATKAMTMIDVLKRRADIEQYLTDLEIERYPDDEELINEAETVITAETKAPEKREEPVQQPARTADKQTVTATAKDKKVQEVAAPDAKLNKAAVDSSLIPKAEPGQLKTLGGYVFDASSKHAVMIVLHKVDPIFVAEVKNAFTRYNREEYFSMGIDIQNVVYNENYMFLVMNGFSNAEQAAAYTQKTQRIAGAQIIPWLASDKFTFLQISTANLEMLQLNKDLNIYREFYEDNYGE